ncbi:hypothetical protein [Pseudomonas putida]|uniref:hypothetical protein n=1 Tax=Pseudomonas putida TaxID=303 RepID=UPI002164DF6A|nr:hypothetical protein [Pseudomonas putida]
MNSEILSFLVPQPELLQMSFFAFIWSATILTALMVALQAKPKGWEKKWRGGNLESSALQADHGSVHDLSETVSTTAEKIAGIMPGMLLVVGLLGTFLGLGMALDHASTILQKSGNASVGAMGGAMQDLTAMMQGLGTKFKTSTWGIMAFILLKVWDLLLGYESRRLAWCIGKVKAQLEQSQQQREAASKAHDLFLQGCMASAAKFLSGAMGKQADALKVQWQQQLKIQQRTESEKKQLLQAGIKSLNTHIAGVTQGISALMQSNTDNQQAIIREIGSAAERNERALSEFADSNGSSLQAGFEGLKSGIAGVTQGIDALLQGQADSQQAVVGEVSRSAERAEQAMSAFADSNSRSLQVGFEGLNTGIAGVTQCIDALLQGQADNQQNIVSALSNSAERTERALGTLGESNRRDLLAGFEGLNSGVAGLTQGIDALHEGQIQSQQIARHGQEITREIASFSKRSEQALTEFTSSSRDNLQALQVAAQTMGEAGSKVSKSAVELQAVVDNLNVRMTEVMEGVKADLNGTLTAMNSDFGRNLSTMGQQLEIATGNLGQVMEAVKVDLGSTIGTMNKDFGNNLVNMTASLDVATQNIKTAIGEMSVAVNDAMQNVAGNMKATADAQKRTTEEFEMVSLNLNTNIIAIEGVVTKLSKDILGGLKAVSESGQRMVSLDKRYDKVSELLVKVPESLDALATVAARPPLDLSPLQQSLKQLTDVAHTINESVKARRAVDA